VYVYAAVVTNKQQTADQTYGASRASHTSRQTKEMKNNVRSEMGAAVLHGLLYSRPNHFSRLSDVVARNMWSLQETPF